MIRLLVSRLLAFTALAAALPAAAQTIEWDRAIPFNGTQTVTTNASAYVLVPDMAIDGKGQAVVVGTVGVISFATKFSRQGEVLWNRTFSAEYRSANYSVAIDGNGHVYIGGGSRASDGSRKFVVSLDGDTGADRWRWNSSAPPNGGGGLVALDGMGGVITAGTLGDKLWTHKIDAATGAQLWASTVDLRLDLDEYPTRIVIDGQGHPYIAGNSYIFNVEGYFVAALDGATGALRWSHYTAEADSSAQTLPDVILDGAGGLYYARGGTHPLLRFDTSNGAQGLVSNVPCWGRLALSADGATVFGSASEEQSIDYSLHHRSCDAAVRTGDGALLWRTEERSDVRASAAVLGLYGQWIIATYRWPNPGSVVTFDARSGATLSTLPFAVTEFDRVTRLRNDASGHVYALVQLNRQGAQEARLVKLRPYGVAPSLFIRQDNFDASAGSDLLWRRTDGSHAQWLMDGTMLLGAARLLTSGTGWEATHTGDFDADGKADILWQHTDGRAAAWLMDGATMKWASALLPAGTGWSAKLVGDFNGDTASDILWQHTDGRTALWLMNDGVQVGGTALIAAGTGWSPTHLADFNGDGKADILWQKADGTVAMWLMDGATQIGGARLLDAGLGWSPKLTGDFNGDGRADIVWQHTDGRVAMWLMNGATQIGGTALIGAGTNFAPTFAADFDGDGKSDLVWERNDQRSAVWLMDGATIRSAVPLRAAGSNWVVKKLGDYNGDGRADIVWQHTDGSTEMWLMNGGASIASRTLIGAGTGWSVSP